MTQRTSGDERSPLPERSEVRTFLIADVRGYTRFTQARGDEAAGALAARFADIADDVVGARGGRLLELRGDEALVVFTSPRQAVRCALDLQERFVDATLADPSLPLGVGIGIDSGEAVPVGAGFRGAALNMAARLCSTARAGEVLASGELAHLARHVDGVRYVDRGRARFKGIEEPVRVVRVLPVHRDPTDRETFRAALGPPDPAARARRRRDRRRLLVIGVGAAAVLVAGLAVLVDRTLREPALSEIGTNAVGVVSIGRNTLHRSVSVGGSPGAIAADDESIWVVNTADDTVSRVDLSAATAPANTIPVGHEPSAIAVGAGAVWVANAGDRSVSRVNPQSRTVVDTIAVGTGPSAVAVAHGRVWVTNFVDGTMTVIDPATDRASAPIAVGAQPLALAAGFGSVWVADSGSSSVSRVDPRTRTVVASVAVGNSPQALAVDDTGVWVANTLDDTVSHIEPAANRVVATLRVGREPTGLATDGDAIWSTNSNADSLTRIDAVRDRVVRTVHVGNAPQAAVVAGGDVWVTARASAARHRGGTFRIVAASDAAESFDPAVSYDPFSWAVTATMNDGLVTYRRTAGPPGAQLVPDLAVGIPAPTGQGRVYAFQLRSGVRFSDGSPVRASDVRRSLERMMRLSDVAGYFGAIVGAPSCSPRHCDLSQGVLVDDASGRVTLRLTRPDPELLYKLAMPFGDVLPSSTPVADLAFGPHPSTGPYTITTSTASRVVLERNPYFRPWSSLAQPAGYPDVIEITFAKTSDEGAGVANSEAVVRGTYDWTPDSLPPSPLDALVRTHTTQVHPFADSGLQYYFLNTREHPFDDVRVRRAVNYAIDRRAAVATFGGPLRARATCQVVVPTVFGYRPYCPYTVSPDAAGNWTGPDLATARRLVTEAHATGAKVTVLGRPGYRDIAGLVTRTMNAIGLRATLRVFPAEGNYFEYVMSAEHHVATGFFGWGLDIPEPSNEFVPLLRCDAINGDRTINVAYFCDPRLDVEMDQALQLQTTDPAAAGEAWAAIDRKVTDQAPWLFLTTVRRFDVLSARVGNYQHHPLLGLLIGQVWVQ